MHREESKILFIQLYKLKAHAAISFGKNFSIMVMHLFLVQIIRFESVITLFMCLVYGGIV